MALEPADQIKHIIAALNKNTGWSIILKKNLIAALLCAILLTGCEVGNIAFNNIESPETAPPEPVVTEATASESPEEETTATEAPATTEPEVNPDTNGSEQLYLELYEHFNQGETEFTFNIPQDDDSLPLLTQRMKKEHPEFFWLSYSYSAEQYREYAELSFACYADINPEEIPAMRKQFDQAAAEVIAQVPQNATDYEKILFIHDWIIDHTVYDVDGRNSTDNGGIYSTAYGAIVNGKAVCSGYAKAFQYFMNQFGIQSNIISGTAKGGSHSWNYVLLDGEYYWVDVTWDDPVSKDGSSQNLFHRYLLVPDEVLLRNHTPDASPEKSPFIPTCSGTKYNYFRMNNCYFESYKLKTVMKTLNAHAKEDSIEIMFQNQQDYEQAYDDLFREKQIYKKGVKELNSFKLFFHDDDTRTIMLKRAESESRSRNNS